MGFVGRGTKKMIMGTVPFRSKQGTVSCTVSFRSVHLYARFVARHLQPSSGRSVGVLKMLFRCSLPFRLISARLSSTIAVGKTKKKLGKLGAVIEKKVIPVETDPNKLVKYVCGSNILNEGNDIELKPVEEYPEWLWELNTGKPKPLSSMGEEDKNTKEYWLKVRKMSIVRHNRLAKLKRW